MGTARFIKRLPVDGEPRIDAALYRVDPPMSLEVFGQEGDPPSGPITLTTLTSEYVRVSASTVPGRPETYIFLADDQGEPIMWRECDGSIIGVLDHTAALMNAGYTIVTPESVSDGPRVRVAGRFLRYEAGVDICLLALQVLKEFRQDDEQGGFRGIHDDVMPRITDLINQGERIKANNFDDPDNDDDELEAWKYWLRDVAMLIPKLWD